MDKIILDRQMHLYRAEARDMLRGNWTRVYVGIALAALFSGMMVLFFTDCVPFGKVSRIGSLGIAERNGYGNFMDLVMFRINGNSTIPSAERPFSTIAMFYSIFISDVFLFGVASFMLNFTRKKDINPAYVFSGFEYYFKCFLLALLQGILIALWTLLLVIPGIVKSMAYSQSYYILAENPEKGVLQCITESRIRMYGNKWEYFLLNISFLGWNILASIPMSIGFFYFDPRPGTVNEFLVVLIASLPVYVAMTYSQTAKTVFYNLLTGYTKQGYTEMPKSAPESQETAQEEKSAPGSQETEQEEKSAPKDENGDPGTGI